MLSSSLLDGTGAVAAPGERCAAAASRRTERRATYVGRCFMMCIGGCRVVAMEQMTSLVDGDFCCTRWTTDGWMIDVRRSLFLSRIHGSLRIVPSNGVRVAIFNADGMEERKRGECFVGLSTLPASGVLRGNLLWPIWGVKYREKGT